MGSIDILIIDTVNELGGEVTDVLADERFLSRVYPDVRIVHE